MAEVNEFKLLTSLEFILSTNRTGDDDDFDSQAIWGMGPCWAIHWGSGIIKRLRTPGLDNLRKVLEVKNRHNKAQKHVNWSVYINWMEECRDRVEKARLLNLKGQLGQLTKQMPVRLEKKTKRQRAVPVRFEDEEEESDTWPEGTVPIAQPLEDEEADETEGEARWGARGVIKKEAETRRREKVPLTDKGKMQTRSKKITSETAKDGEDEALIGAFPL